MKFIKIPKRIKVILPFILFMLVLTPAIEAQLMREEVQQCPVIIENKRIYYYIPSDNGAYFQLPPDRKPSYVTILQVPWVSPLTSSVLDTQNEILSQLLKKVQQPAMDADSKSLFLRKLAWCVMLQYRIVQELDERIITYVHAMKQESDQQLQKQSETVLKLIEGYQSQLPGNQQFH